MQLHCRINAVALSDQCNCIACSWGGVGAVETAGLVSIATTPRWASRFCLVAHGAKGLVGPARCFIQAMGNVYLSGPHRLLACKAGAVAVATSGDRIR